MELKINKNISVVLIIKRDGEEKEIIKLIKEGVLVPFKFFNKVKKLKFGIEIIYSREEFDQKMGRKTEDWMIANASAKYFMIFNPTEMGKQAFHKSSEFGKCVTHETTHILHKEIDPKFSNWMGEGIAQYIAHQQRTRKIELKNINYFLKNNLFKNSDYNKFTGSQGYEISSRLINFLMVNYSKETVIKLLSLKYDYDESSEKEFCKILGMDKNKIISTFEKVLKEKISNN